MPIVRSENQPDTELAAGRYIVENLIGTGGMGRVYLGRHAQLQQVVAIKYLQTSPRTNSDSARKRFHAEALSYASINHPNIVKLLDFDCDHNELCMILEFVPGDHLRQFLRDRGQCHPLFVIEVITQIAQGLAAAHDKSTVHRDLKPENIILSPTTHGARDFRVKLLDFGIAKNLDADERHTQEGSVCGTPSYMSPEQARGHDIDCRSDLYSLGVLMFEMLANRLPYTGESRKEVMQAHCYTPIPSVAEYSRYHIPELLKEFLIRCLAKNPSQRFQSAEDLINELDYIAEHEYNHVKAARYNLLSPEEDLALRPSADGSPSQISLEEVLSQSRIASSSVSDEVNMRSKDQMSLKSGRGVEASNVSATSSLGEMRSIVVKPALVEKAPVISSREFNKSGLKLEGFVSWIHGIWSEIQLKFEQNNTQSIVYSLGFCSVLILLLSIGLSPSQPSYQSRDLVVVATNDKAVSEPVPVPQPEPRVIRKTVGASIVPRFKTQSRSELAKPRPREDFYETSLASAQELYQENRLREAQLALNKISSYPRAKELKIKVLLLNRFNSETKGMTCFEYRQYRDSDQLHVEISDHPVVAQRFGRCANKMPPGVIKLR